MGLRQALGRDVRVGSFRPMPLAAWLAAGLAVLDIASTLLMLVLGTRAGQRHWERHHHWRHDAGDGHHWRHNESGQAEGGGWTKNRHFSAARRDAAAVAQGPSTIAPQRRKAPTPTH
eukprot:COSAG01_NODE_39682_length_473_cov_1.008021_1_plen_116_part_01